MDNLKIIYSRRFAGDIKFRDMTYGILCRSFFQKYVPADATVLDVAAGYCEFINNIKAKSKIALDLNPDTKKFAASGVKVIISKSTNMARIRSGSIDLVFVSNLFEHLEKEEIVKTIREIRRVLRKDGSLLVLQPNIRYCYRDYWMFFDHITALDDRSLREVLEINGFEIIENKPRFLPYTTKGSLPKSLFMLRLYLKMPFIWPLFGKQAFIYAKKC